MTKLEAQNLKANDRVIDTRDGCKATVVMDASDEIVRVRYDDSLSSNYIHVDGCGHLQKLDA